MGTKKIAQRESRPVPPMVQEARDHIHAFLENQERLRGTDFVDHVQDQIDGGRRAVAQLAAGRAVNLTPAECADVACFIRCTAPTKPLDPRSRISGQDPYLGFLRVMEVVEDSLRDTKPDLPHTEGEPSKPHPVDTVNEHLLQAKAILDLIEVASADSLYDDTIKWASYCAQNHVDAANEAAQELAQAARQSETEVRP